MTPSIQYDNDITGEVQLYRDGLKTYFLSKLDRLVNVDEIKTDNRAADDEFKPIDVRAHIFRAVNAVLDTLTAPEAYDPDPVAIGGKLAEAIRDINLYEIPINPDALTSVLSEWSEILTDTEYSFSERFDRYAEEIDPETGLNEFLDRFGEALADYFEDTYNKAAKGDDRNIINEVVDEAREALTTNGDLSNEALARGITETLNERLTEDEFNALFSDLAPTEVSADLTDILDDVRGKY